MHRISRDALQDSRDLFPDGSIATESCVVTLHAIPVGTFAYPGSVSHRFPRIKLLGHGCRRDRARKSCLCGTFCCKSCIRLRYLRGRDAWSECSATRCKSPTCARASRRRPSAGRCSRAWVLESAASSFEGVLMAGRRRRWAQARAAEACVGARHLSQQRGQEMKLAEARQRASQMRPEACVGCRRVSQRRR